MISRNPKPSLSLSLASATSKKEAESSGARIVNATFRIEKFGGAERSRRSRGLGACGTPANAKKKNQNERPISSSSTRETRRKEKRKTRRLGAGQSYCTMFTSSAAPSDHDERRARTSARSALPSSPYHRVVSLRSRTPRAQAESPFRRPLPSLTVNRRRRRRPTIWGGEPPCGSTWRLSTWSAQPASRVQFSIVLWRG